MVWWATGSITCSMGRGKKPKTSNRITNGVSAAFSKPVRSVVTCALVAWVSGPVIVLL